MVASGSYPSARVNIEIYAYWAVVAFGSTLRFEAKETLGNDDQHHCVAGYLVAVGGVMW